MLITKVSLKCYICSYMETGRLVIAERLIAWIQILMGISLLICAKLFVYDRYDDLLARFGQPWTSTAMFNLLMDMHGIIILCICLVSAGYFLLKQKPAGWMLTMATTLLIACIAVYYFVTDNRKGAATNSDMNTQVFFVGMTLLSVAIFFTMLSNPVRERYQPTIKHAMIIATLTSAILAEQILWHSFFN